MVLVKPLPVLRCRAYNIGQRRIVLFARTGGVMFPEYWPWVAGGLALATAFAFAAWKIHRRRPPRVGIERARKLFHLQRERVEHRFFVLAASSGKPRGLEWVDCDFEDAVSFARDRLTGRLRALVAVTIRFKAIEGGGMEDNPNVGNPRAASAVFQFDNDQWATEGRALFNLNPLEAIARESLEVVE